MSRPWWPDSGLTTTGLPRKANASAASSALCARTPSGTGMPAAASSCLVTSLSQAMSTPMAEVCPVLAAHTSWRRQP